MTINNQAVVPVDEIKKLTQGSYEQLIVDVTKAASSMIEGLLDGESWEVVSTFANHAIVLSESGVCYRVKFERTNGAVEVMTADKYPVRVVAQEDYLKSEARKIVDTYLAGGVTEAVSRLTAITARVPSKRPVADERVISVVSEAVNGPRLWKTRYTESKAHFHAFLGESVAARRSPRFRPLYESEVSVETAGVDTYFSVVQDAMQALESQFGELQQTLEDSALTLKSLLPKITEAESTEVLTALDIFAQDLLTDIRSVHKIVRESVHQVSGIESLGRMHDLISENFNQYEVAVRFVVEMTKSLTSEANPKGA